jgi:hypothetical protein
VWNGSVIPVASGGTGLASLPTSLLAGDGTNSISKVTGPLGYVLTSTGETTLPVFKASGGGDMILASTQTVTGNKTFTDGTLRLNGSSGGVTTLVANSNSSSTVELPPNGIIVNRDRLEILLNKTLTSPILNGTPNLGSSIGTSLNISGTVTAGTFIGPLTGNATTATTAGSFSGTLVGDVTGSQGATVVSSVAGFPSATIGARLTTVGNAVSGNTPNTLVLRGAGGNFTGGVISADEFVGPLTGSITGNAATVTTNANLTGEATSLGNDVTLTNSAVIGKKLIGYTTGTGAVGAGDNILQAIGKVEGTTNLKAPINNPSFTGTVLIPSPFNLGVTSVTTTGTQLNYLKDASGTSGTGSVVFNNSPTFTGAPTLPTGTIGFTQDASNSTTALATTAFVSSAVTTATPDATSSKTGKIQLAGDLTGTAASPAIATSAVTTAKIADANVTTAKIADANVTAAKILNANVTYAKIQNVSADNVLGRVTPGSGIVEEIPTTGSGNVVRATSPALVTPNLGTPASVTLTNATGLPISSGVSGLATGVAAFLGSPTSDNMLAAITSTTGTGDPVFSIYPALVRPRATMLIGNSTLPTNTAGIGVTTVTVTGTNLAGTVEIVHNGGGAGGGDLVTITYVGTAFDSGSYPILYPANAATAALPRTEQVFAVGTTINFKIKAGIDPLLASTYKWNYHVIGN